MCSSNFVIFVRIIAVLVKRVLLCVVLQIQFEVAHNGMHAWLGGAEKYSMGHLHYASYDPAFILHHSFVDRIFAIWQALQKTRWVIQQ
jgi:hypothetical protein